MFVRLREFFPGQGIVQMVPGAFPLRRVVLGANFQVHAGAGSFQFIMRTRRFHSAQRLIKTGYFFTVISVHFSGNRG